MASDEIWLLKWHEYMSYLDANKHRPSKYHAEDMVLVNWLKYNRRLLKNNKLSQAKKDKIKKLLAEADKYRRVNQYSYYHK